MDHYPTFRFNDSGTEVTIVFDENKDQESLVYTTKEAVFQTINVLLGTEQITLEKADAMRQEILNAENLTPNTEDHSKTPVLGIYIIKPQYFFFKENAEPITPYVQLCKNGSIIHWHIYCTSGSTIAFRTKDGGRLLVEYLKHNNFISVQEEKMLLKEIDELDIPLE